MFTNANMFIETRDDARFDRRRAAYGDVSLPGDPWYRASRTYKMVKRNVTPETARQAHFMAGVNFSTLPLEVRQSIVGMAGEMSVTFAPDLSRFGSIKVHKFALTFDDKRSDADPYGPVAKRRTDTLRLRMVKDTVYESPCRWLGQMNLIEWYTDSHYEERDSRVEILNIMHCLFDTSVTAYDINADGPWDEHMNSVPHTEEVAHDIWYMQGKQTEVRTLKLQAQRILNDVGWIRGDAGTPYECDSKPFVDTTKRLQMVFFPLARFLLQRKQWYSEGMTNYKCRFEVVKLDPGCGYGINFTEMY